MNYKISKNGDVLYKGEYLRKDGSYQFRKSYHGRKIVIYDKSLDNLRKREAELESMNLGEDEANAVYTTFGAREILLSAGKSVCKREEANGFCYFVENGRHVKIGFTGNLTQRMHDLQTANSDKLRLICSIPFRSVALAEKCEKKLHNKFEKYRISGEWFNILYRINTLELREVIGV